MNNKLLFQLYFYFEKDGKATTPNQIKLIHKLDIYQPRTSSEQHKDGHKSKANKHKQHEG